MAFYEITISGSKTFIVEADTEQAALQHPVSQDEFTGFMGDVDWEADTMRATNHGTPDLDQCKRHDVKVFDRNGIPYFA